MEMCHFVPLQSHANCKFCAGYITSWLTSYDAMLLKFLNALKNL